MSAVSFSSPAAGLGTQSATNTAFTASSTAPAPASSGVGAAVVTATKFTASVPPAIEPSATGDTRFLHVTQYPTSLEAVDVTYEALANLQTRNGQMQVWEQAPTTAVDQIIGRNASATSEKARFAGLGSALLEQVASTGASYRQTIVNVGAAYSPGTIQGKATGALWAIQSRPSASAELTIQTQSGATVRISIADQREPIGTGSGIAVQIDVEGDLTPQEKQALQSLAKGFDQAIEGLTGEPPTLDLGGLSKFDTQALGKVEFKTSLYGVDENGSRIQKLGARYTADASKREIEIKTPQGTVAMKTDLRQPALWGTAEQKAYAVQQYLGRIDKAAERGNADAELVDLFKSSFTAMNGSYGSAAGASGSRATTGLGPAQSVDLGRDAGAFSEEDQSLLTGLADFNASITATRRASNPRRLKEVDSFDYTLNQSTQVSGTAPGNRALTQTQTAKLQASFHQSLDGPSAKLELSSDSATQNYYYQKVEDSSSTQVELAYEKDEPVRALITQTASQSLQSLKVENNRITENTADPARQQSKQTDLLPLLKELRRQQEANALADDEKQKTLREWNGMVLGDWGTA